MKTLFYRILTGIICFLISYTLNLAIKEENNNISNRSDVNYLCSGEVE